LSSKRTRIKIRASERGLRNELESPPKQSNKNGVIKMRCSKCNGEMRVSSRQDGLTVFICPVCECEDALRDYPAETITRDYAPSHCRHCGSTNTRTYSDGVTHCNSCGSDFAKQTKLAETPKEALDAIKGAKKGETIIFKEKKARK